MSIYLRRCSLVRLVHAMVASAQIARPSSMPSAGSPSDPTPGPRLSSPPLVGPFLLDSAVAYDIKHGSGERSATFISVIDATSGSVNQVLTNENTIDDFRL